MQRLTVLLALLVAGCGTTHTAELTTLPEIVDTDAVTLIPEVGTPSLIPEVGNPVHLPEVAPPATVVVKAKEPKVQTPDYHSLQGAKLTVTESGVWVLRSSGGGSYGDLSERAYGSADYEMEDGGYALDTPSAAPMKRSRPMRPTEAAGPTGGSYDEYRPVVEAPAANPLRAGTTDDNEAFGAYLEFLATWTDQAGISGSYAPTDVRDRQYVQVVDRTGLPLPGATVDVRFAGEFARIGSTYGDGTVPFYPHLSDADPTGDGYTVQVRYGAERLVVPWDGQDTLTVRLDQAVPADRIVPLDVVFVIDTTGSMSDEIDRIKTTLLSVTEQIRSSDRPVDLRYGAVLYRDIGDEYVTKRHGFTTDIQAFDDALQGISANGGGDGPESLNQGLAETVHAMEWRRDSAKLAFLVADAPPHMDYQGDVTYAQTAMAAVAKGIRIHTVAASGLDGYGGSGSLVYRQTAQLTQGKFIFIEYGSLEASAASHGVTGSVKGNNLDDIIYEQVSAEIEGWRVPSPTVASL